MAPLKFRGPAFDTPTMTTEFAPRERADAAPSSPQRHLELADAVSAVERLASRWPAMAGEMEVARAKPSTEVYRGLLDQRGEPWRAVPEPERVKLAQAEYAVNTDQLRRQRRAGRARESAPYHHLVVLSSYHVANLRALLYAVESGEIPGWNNGDWVGETSARLPVLSHAPNRIPRPMS